MMCISSLAVCTFGHTRAVSFVIFLNMAGLRALAHRQMRSFRRIVHAVKSETQALSPPASAGGQSQHNRSELTLLSMAQTAQLSGVSEVDLLGLVEYGVLTPAMPDKEPHIFDSDCVMTLQRAALMRQDLALDSHGFALAVMFLNQITGLEAQLIKSQHDLSDCRSADA